MWLDPRCSARVCCCWCVCHLLTCQSRAVCLWQCSWLFCNRFWILSVWLTNIRGVRPDCLIVSTNSSCTICKLVVSRVKRQDESRCSTYGIKEPVTCSLIDNAFHQLLPCHLQSLSLDGVQTFRQATNIWLPSARLCVDRYFHVLKYLLRGLGIWQTFCSQSEGL